jgi:hypothetical protein
MVTESIPAGCWRPCASEAFFAANAVKRLLANADSGGQISPQLTCQLQTHCNPMQIEPSLC